MLCHMSYSLIQLCPFLIIYFECVFKVNSCVVSIYISLREGSAISLREGSAVSVREGSAVSLREGSAVSLREGSAVSLREGSAVSLREGSAVSLTVHVKGALALTLYHDIYFLPYYTLSIFDILFYVLLRLVDTPDIILLIQVVALQ